MKTLKRAFEKQMKLQYIFAKQIIVLNYFQPELSVPIVRHQQTAFTLKMLIKEYGMKERLRGISATQDMFL